MFNLALKAFIIITCHRRAMVPTFLSKKPPLPVAVRGWYRALFLGPILRKGELNSNCFVGCE